MASSLRSDRCGGVQAQDQALLQKLEHARHDAGLGLRLNRKAKTASPAALLRRGADSGEVERPRLADIMSVSMDRENKLKRQVPVALRAPGG